MSTLRDRKPHSAAAADAEDAASSTSTADAALATAAANATAAAATHEEVEREQVVAVQRRGPNCIQRVCSVLPFLLLFLAIFCGMSYAQTSTFDYGLSEPIGQQLKSRGISWRAIRQRVIRTRNAVAEMVGLRAPRRRRSTPAKGYSAAASQPDPQPDWQPGGSGDIFSEVLPPRPVIPSPPAKRDPSAVYLTPSQLSAFDGSSPTDPRIYLSVYGRIFDVSTGVIFYGMEGGYHELAGRDVSRGFVTNCFINPDQHDIRGLDEQQLRGIDHWYEFYSTHSTYRAIGWLDVPPIPADAPLPNDECRHEQSQGQTGDKPAATATPAAATTAAAADAASVPIAVDAHGAPADAPAPQA